MLKRMLTSIIGIPLSIVILIFANKYIVDIIVGILALMGVYEVFKCLKEKYNPVFWIGFLACLLIPFIHIIPESILNILFMLFPLGILVVLLMQGVFTRMKTSFSDIAVSYVGIIYIVGLFTFVAMLFGYENNGMQLGKYYIWYLFLATWGSDAFAYLIGVKFGKHKFSKISPKKSIEGSIAGIVGGICLMLIATIIFNNCFDLSINYIFVALMGLVLTILGQIGDLVASSIKRSVDVKDFSNLLPGHGGIVDRFDSVIFAAPFAFFLFTLLL